jgi:hypothetical protein
MCADCSSTEFLEPHSLVSERFHLKLEAKILVLAIGVHSMTSSSCKSHMKSYHLVISKWYRSREENQQRVIKAIHLENIAVRERWFMIKALFHVSLHPTFEHKHKVIKGTMWTKLENVRTIAGVPSQEQMMSWFFNSHYQGNKLVKYFTSSSKMLNNSRNTNLNEIKSERLR